MAETRTSSPRVVLTLAASILALVVGAGTAFGQASAPPSDPSTTDGGAVSSGSTGVAVARANTVGPDVAVSSIAPAWCCGGTGVVPGLTTYGQAMVHRQGQAARDAAIAEAVQDATAQATVAADAAGIVLGPIIDMQVSATPLYYPMEATAGSTSPGSAGGGGGIEPVPAPDAYLGSVSVTITWSLG